MSKVADRLLRQEPQIEPDALPCPFCGSPAEIQYWHGGKPTKRLISCTGRPDHDDWKCAVGPMVTGETRAEALSNWNKRASP